MKTHLGSVVQIEFETFYVCGLCTNWQRDFGYLLRFYEPKFDQPVRDTALLRNFPFRTMAFFPLEEALKDPGTTIIGQLKLTWKERRTPVFRQLGLSLNGESPKGWWIVRGEKERFVSKLKPKMAFYPDHGIVNYAWVQDFYEKDLRVNSPELLSKGPLSFDPYKQL